MSKSINQSKDSGLRGVSRGIGMRGPWSWLVVCRAARTGRGRRAEEREDGEDGGRRRGAGRGVARHGGAAVAAPHSGTASPGFAAPDPAGVQLPASRRLEETVGPCRPGPFRAACGLSFVRELVRETSVPTAVSSAGHHSHSLAIIKFSFIPRIGCQSRQKKRETKDNQEDSAGAGIAWRRNGPLRQGTRFWQTT